MKSIIEPELENKHFYCIHAHSETFCIRCINKVIQKARVELDKRKFCVRCFYNLPHDMDIDTEKTEIIHSYAIMLDEIEKVFGK